MDIGDILRNSVAAKRAEEFKNSPQLSLGELILIFAPILKEQQERVNKGEEEAEVMFDFEYCFPTHLQSWRGVYAELAFGYTFIERGSGGDMKPMKVHEFVALLNSAMGTTFEGYKGGDFLMGKTTPLWVANYGNSGHTAVMGVVNEGYQIIITTQYLSD